MEKLLESRTLYLKSKHSVHHASRGGGIGDNVNLDASADQLQGSLLDTHVCLVGKESITRKVTVIGRCKAQQHHSDSRELGEPQHTSASPQAENWLLSVLLTVTLNTLSEYC